MESLMEQSKTSEEYKDETYNIPIWFVLGFITFGISDFALLFQLSKDIKRQYKNMASVSIFAVIYLMAKIADFTLSYWTTEILDELILWIGRITFSVGFGMSLERAFKSRGGRDCYTLRYVLLGAFTIVSLPVIAAADMNEYNSCKSDSHISELLVAYIFGPILVLLILLILYCILCVLLPDNAWKVLEVVKFIVFNGMEAVGYEGIKH